MLQGLNVLHFSICFKVSRLYVTRSLGFESFFSYVTRSLGFAISFICYQFILIQGAHVFMYAFQGSYNHMYYV